MKKVQISVYQFGELSKEAQQKVLDSDLRYVNTEHEWYDFIRDEFVGKAESLGYTNVEMMFSGFSSQGDGACFTAGVDIPKWLRAHRLGNKYKALAKAYRDGDAAIKITHSWRHYFATSTNVDPEDYRASAKAQEQMAEVVELIEKERESLGNDLYRTLEKQFDYLVSDEAVKEMIEANGWEFREDGSPFWG